MKKLIKNQNIVNQSFITKLELMTPQDHINNMVNALKKPTTIIDMKTFGTVNGIQCFGCAATNAILRIAEIENPLDYVKNVIRDDTSNETNFYLYHYERAIDYLRSGQLFQCNLHFRYIQLKKIINPNNIYLPTLTNDYTIEQLDIYTKLALDQKPSIPN